MSTQHLLHPELHPILKTVPIFKFRRDNLENFRNARASEAILGDAGAVGVRREEVFIKSNSAIGGSYAMSCLLYAPEKRGSTGAYLHIHETIDKLCV